MRRTISINSYLSSRISQMKNIRSQVPMFQYHSTSQKDDPLIDHHGIQRDNFAYVFAFQYAVEGAEKCGVTDFVIITGTNMDSLEDHFDFATELEELLETKHNDKMLEEIRRTNKAKPP